MKTRSGFVSNSSSSSFVVAFPRKPKTVDDVFKMLFGDISPETKISPRWSSDNQHSAKEIAEQVFSDIKRRCPKGTSLNKIIEEFQGRYYYCTSDNVMTFTDGGQMVSARGWTFLSQGLFFGVDSNALNSLEKLHLEEEETTKRHQKEREEYINAWLVKKGVKIVASYDNPGWNVYRKKYDAAESSLYKRSKVYQAFLSKQWGERNALWKKIVKARTKVAKADAVAMVEAFKNAFIANFSYGDNHGDVSGTMGTILEQGTVWDNIPHVKINHH